MTETFIMSYCSLALLEKFRITLKINNSIDILKLLQDIDKYANEIF